MAELGCAPAIEVALVVMLDDPVPRRGLRGRPRFKLRAQDLRRFQRCERCLDNSSVGFALGSVI
jgi:hypothetical protein